MEKRWTDEAWADYCWWQTHDRKTLSRINDLLRDIERDPTAKPKGRGEILGRGMRSVRINKVDRLTYAIDGEALLIMSCRGHYM